MDIYSSFEWDIKKILGKNFSIRRDNKDIRVEILQCMQESFVFEFFWFKYRNVIYFYKCVYGRTCNDMSASGGFIGSCYYRDRRHMRVYQRFQNGNSKIRGAEKDYLHISGFIACMFLIFFAFSINKMPLR